MIQATVILGEDAVRRYGETDKIPTKKWLSQNGGHVEIKSFETQAEYNAYAQALNDLDGWHGGIILSPMSSPVVVGKTICTKCGSTNVRCEGIINPNDPANFEIASNAYFDGSCFGCKSFTTLSNVGEVCDEIDKRFQVFVDNNNNEPTYASCQIVFRDDNTETTYTIKLNEGVDESNDDEIGFYCGGISELKSLTDPGINDFVIIGCSEMY